LGSDESDRPGNLQNESESVKDNVAAKEQSVSLIQSEEAPGRAASE